MSWRTASGIDSFDGFGFDVDRADEEDIFNFFVKHEKSLPDISREIVMNIVNDENRKLDDFYYNSDGIARFVSEIMTNETGYEFGFMLGNGGEDAVIYRYAYPWDLSEKEKNLTKEEIVGALASYAEELGVCFYEDYIHIEIDTEY